MYRVCLQSNTLHCSELICNAFSGGQEKKNPTKVLRWISSYHNEHIPHLKQYYDT